jgi:hypothetical protein
VGTRTNTARADVLAARAELDAEIIRLEAAARSAVDIPAKVRREPVKTAGLAAGAVFLVAGGPQRLFRRVKRAVVGPDEPLPKSLLPDDVEKALKKLGTDGERVRGTLEREFADYLEEHREERQRRDPGAAIALLLASIARPVAQQAARRMAQQLFSPENASFQDAVQRIRERSAPSTPAAPSRADRSNRTS